MEVGSWSWRLRFYSGIAVASVSIARMSLPRRFIRLCLVTLLAASPLAGACRDREADEAQFHPSTPAITVPPPKEVLRLPKKPGSYRFAALGDMGRGDKW